MCIRDSREPALRGTDWEQGGLARALWRVREGDAGAVLRMARGHGDLGWRIGAGDWFELGAAGADCGSWRDQGALVDGGFAVVMPFWRNVRRGGCCVCRVARVNRVISREMGGFGMSV